MAVSEVNNDKPAVRFEQIEKSFDGETLVIKDLNLEIAQGEFLTMLGPSGSGKTTTLMMLAGFETPTHGEIYLDDQPIGSVSLLVLTVLASPVVAGSLLWITSRREIMGENVNSRAQVVLGLIGFALLIAMSANLAVTKVIPKVTEALG